MALVAAAIEVQLICDVPALNVRFVLVAKFTAAAVALKVNVLDPSVIVLTLVLLDDKEPAVTL